MLDLYPVSNYRELYAGAHLRLLASWATRIDPKFVSTPQMRSFGAG